MWVALKKIHRKRESITVTDTRLQTSSTAYKQGHKLEEAIKSETRFKV